MGWRLFIPTFPVLLMACDHGANLDLNSEVVPVNTEIFGNRFRVVADLHGVGSHDTVTEVYFSQKLGAEAPKFIADWSYDSLVERSYQLEPLVMLRSTSAPMYTVSKAGHGFGLLYLVNEGDLDGDGADELGYVLDNADWSSLNTYHVISLTEGRWIELFAFPIWDWQLPAVPGSERLHVRAGQTEVVKDTELSTRTATGLVLPVEPGVVKAIGNVGDATLDTMEIHFGKGQPARILGSEF